MHIQCTYHFSLSPSPSLPLPPPPSPSLLSGVCTCTCVSLQSPSKALLADCIGENDHLTDNWDDAEGYYS